MPKFYWSDDYAIGIQVIDQQHKRIFDYINQIYDTPVNGSRSNVLGDVLNNLVDYTYSHFEFEEALMEEADYAELSEHQLVHQNFRQLIDQLKSRFDGGEPVAEELAEVLKHWLLSHIQTDDSSYAEVVRKRFNVGSVSEHQRSWLRTALERYFH